MTKSAFVSTLVAVVVTLHLSHSATSERNRSPVLFEQTHHYCCLWYESNFDICGNCDSINVENTGCLNLEWYSGRVTSIWIFKLLFDENCVKIWDSRDCKGESKTMEEETPCQSNLADCSWDDRIMSVSECQYEQPLSTTPAPTTTTELPEVEESAQCPVGSWVQEIRVKPGYGLELDCHEPGSENKTSMIRAARGASLRRSFKSQCVNKPMRGVAFTWNAFTDAEARGYCNNDYLQQLGDDGGLCSDWKEAVCGLRLTKRGNRITQQAVICCTLPNPAGACNPTDRYEVIKECDNIAGYIDTDCSYNKSVGISFFNSAQTGSSGQAEFYSSMYEGQSFSQGQHSAPNSGISALSSDLSTNFDSNLGTSYSTGYKWDLNTSSLWNEERVYIVDYTVAPGVRTVLEQVVGTCDFMKVRTHDVRRTDFDKYGHRIFVPSLRFTTTTPTTTTVKPPPVSEEDSQQLHYPASTTVAPAAHPPISIPFLIVTGSMAIFITVCLIYYCVRPRLQNAQPSPRNEMEMREGMFLAGPSVSGTCEGCGHTGSQEGCVESKISNHNHQ